MSASHISIIVLHQMVEPTNFELKLQDLSADGEGELSQLSLYRGKYDGISDMYYTVPCTG